MALAEKLKQEVADLKSAMGEIEAEERAAIAALDAELAAIPNRPLARGSARAPTRTTMSKSAKSATSRSFRKISSRKSISRSAKP